MGKREINRSLPLFASGLSSPRPLSRNIAAWAFLGHSGGGLPSAIVSGRGGTGPRGGPRGDVWNLLAGSRGGGGARGPGRRGEDTTSQTMSPLPLLLAVVGRLYGVALSSRSRPLSRRPRRYRRRQKIPARAARAVPTMDTTMAMVSCASVNCAPPCWFRSSACAWDERLDQRACLSPPSPHPRER